MESSAIDFCVGGKYLLAMKDPAGKVTWSTGEYQEIVPLKKTVSTDCVDGWNTSFNKLERLVQQK